MYKTLFDPWYYQKFPENPPNCLFYNTKNKKYKSHH